jgi:pimeloyl-ACP methyl ester carboxylesterase
MIETLAMVGLTVLTAWLPPVDEVFPFDPEAPAAGRWVGQVTVAERSRHAVIDIERAGDAWRADATVLAAMVLDQPASAVRIDGPDVRLTLTIRGAEHALAATVSEDGQRMTGQAPEGAAIELRRIPSVTDLPEPMTFAGSLEVPGAQLVMAVTMAQSPQGTWFAELDIPLQSVSATPLFDVSFEDGRFSGMLPGPAPAHLELTMAAGNDSMSGVFRQGTAQLPLEMKREATGSSGISRPQHPVPPFPYASATVRAAHPDGHVIVGELTIPDADRFGPPPYPVAVLISGSGQQDRDETVMGHKPFLVLADHLTRRGIAVMRYDDRGIGASTVEDMSSVMNATTVDFASDTAAVIDALRMRADIDADRIGLIGHSEGGIIAPMLAAERDDIAFMVLLAATAVPGREVLLQQTRLIHESMGADAARLAEMEAAQREVLDLIVEGGTPQDIRVAIRRLVKIQTDGALGPNDLAAAVEMHSRQSMLPWMKYFITYDPKVALGNVRCPVFALNGTLDLQVSSDQNLPVIEHSLRNVTGARDVTVRRYEGLNHLFQPAVTGAPDEYATIATTMDERVLEDVATWINDRMRKTHEQDEDKP